MRAGQWLRERLRDISPLREIVGDKIFRCFLPPKFDPPAVVYRRMRTETGQHTRGPEGLRKVAFDVHCLADDDETTEAIAGVIVTGLETLMPTLPKSYDGIWVQRVAIEDERDEAETISHADGTLWPSIVLSVVIAHTKGNS